ncbi:MFS transporter [Ochrobactrum soli]|uniref:MFS transporter n=1 Tax=Ochrobactrum soli TaxID=2448455 RepID=UPI001FCE7214|nr:MFS transporter [[Ochrobactrum] soli]
MSRPATCRRACWRSSSASHSASAWQEQPSARSRSTWRSTRPEVSSCRGRPSGSPSPSSASFWPSQHGSSCRRRRATAKTHHGPLSFASVISPFKVVLGNPQSWLAGIIGGLLFVPTTIGALVWATAFLHDGEHMSMAAAASDASMVPIGWVIGCPLLGYISDRIGRRKPVLIGGALVMLGAGLAAIYVPAGTFPRYSVALVLGIASGAAMIPFAMIKEANPSGVKGTAAGVMNFLVFLTTGLMSPFISRLMVPSSGTPMTLADFQHAFLPLVGGVVVAILLGIVIRETGHGSHTPAAPPSKV